MKFIIIILLVYLGFRYLLPIILRMLVGKVISNAQQQYQQESRQYQNNTPPPNATQNENHASGKKPIIDDDEGEYVDFEEIK